VVGGNNVIPSQPGYSARLRESSIARYEFPDGTYWTESRNVSVPSTG
jgi:L-fuconate dehydratase